MPSNSCQTYLAAVKRCTFVLTSILIVAGAFTAVPSSAKEQPVVRLTRKPTVPYTAIPTVEIYPNGLVWIQRYDGTRRTKMIDVAKLSALLDKLDRIGFYRITTQSVETSMQKPTEIRRMPDGVEAAAERIIITDCDTATVSVRRGAKVYTVSCYAVEEIATYYPKATDLNILKRTIAEVYKTVREP